MEPADSMGTAPTRLLTQIANQTIAWQRVPLWTLVSKAINYPGKKHYRSAENSDFNLLFAATCKSAQSKLLVKLRVRIQVFLEK